MGCTSRSNELRVNVSLNGKLLEGVKIFKYLKSQIIIESGVKGKFFFFFYAVNHWDNL